MSVNQITQIRTASGQVVSLTDWSSRILYSTAEILSGAQDEEVRLFSYTESDTVVTSDNMPAGSRRIATKEDTNIQTASQMASTEEYLVYALACEMSVRSHDAEATPPIFVDSTVPGQPMLNVTTMKQLHSQLLLELDVAEKTFPIGSIGMFPAGFGVSAAPALAGALSQVALAEGSVPSREAVEAMSIPVHIGGTEEYAVIIHNPSGDRIEVYDNDGAVVPDVDDVGVRALRFRVSLCGLHKRPTA